MKILFQNNDYIVCIKPIGLSSEYSESDASLPFLIKEETGIVPYAVHRLDTGVGGVMVYALNKASASYLSGEIQNGNFSKNYICVVRGCPKERCGKYTDLLFKDSRKNKTFVVDKKRTGVKEATLEYEVLNTVTDEKSELSLVKVHLITGRSHQIRVQFASRKMPLIGDGKYGSRDKSDRIALWSYCISFKDKSGKSVEYSAYPCEDENKTISNLIKIQDNTVK